jgi:amidohydrolase
MSGFSLRQGQAGIYRVTEQQYIAKQGRKIMTAKTSRAGLLSSTLLGAAIAFAGYGASAQSLSPELAKKVIQSVDADTKRLTEIFKDIHQHAELAFMETRTAGIVAKELEALGYEVKTGIGKTGVVGIMRNGDGPVVLWRADMDAIAVEEATGVPYASKVRTKLPDGTDKPVGHLCGHDAHTTWMLSLAKTMATHKDQWKGTLILLGQPAEEVAEGANAMVEDGLFTKFGVPKPDYALAMHTAPFPTGTLVGVGGVVMAGTELVDVTFHGVGGHGSSPQYTKDPVVMAAFAIAQYQAIVSRVIDPREPAVITVGAIEAGTTNNVIPETAVLKLNFRFFNEKVREQLFDGVVKISNGIARTYGLPEDKLPTIVRKGYATVTANDAEVIKRTNAALLMSGVVNEKTLLTDFKPVTGSEDFPMLFHSLKGVKATYRFLGTASPEVYAKARKEGKELPFANHQPIYLVDLNAIPIGAKVAGIMVMEMMAK